MRECMHKQAVRSHWPIHQPRQVTLRSVAAILTEIDSIDSKLLGNVRLRRSNSQGAEDLTRRAACRQKNKCVFTTAYHSGNTLRWQLHLSHVKGGRSLISSTEMPFLFL